MIAPAGSPPLPSLAIPAGALAPLLKAKNPALAAK